MDSTRLPERDGMARGTVTPPSARKLMNSQFAENVVGPAVDGVGNLEDVGLAATLAVVNVAVAGVGQDVKRDRGEAEAAHCLCADGICVEVLEVLEHWSCQLSVISGQLSARELAG